MFRKIMILGAAMLASVAAAQESGPGRAGLERFNEGLDSLHAGFSQIVINPDGSTLESGGGEVWISRPDRFRWTYAGEFPELIVADGEQVWLFDESLEQVTVRQQSGLAADSPLMLLTDLSALDAGFSVTELGQIDGVNLLELSSNSNEVEFDRVVLGLRGDELVSMIMEDAFGIRTEIVFDSVERNPLLAEDLFHFTPAPGVDVIGADLLQQP